MSFELPKLPYAPDALEPHISKRTIEFHYGKHHQGYVNNLNKLVPGTKYENATLEQIIKGAEGGIFNNGAQVWNHSFYFATFSPAGRREPYDKLGELITGTFGSFEGFKEEFSNAAATLFGSGWAWLVKKSDGTLDIIQEPNAGNPLRSGLFPLLTIDVWEHAYYLDYQNSRPLYIQSLWNVIDWEVVVNRYLA
ncbi:MAG: superoxide dismutase [Bacteroidales bacterium]|nr:superoxide dismutase [Bacteroidales bacterium]